MPGPLDGIRIIELAAIGPAPYGVMLLADLGAEVVRIDRVSAARGAPGVEISMRGLSRGRRSVAVDLKHPDGVAIVRQLVADADVFVEGMRPGVAERLGVGPDELLAANARLVYARMTGWGQDGPLADRAGHDIDYAAIAGALHPIGDAANPPPVPLNLVADFGGGGTFLAMGVMAALLERERSGRGQVVDAAMIDGAASLTSFFHGLMALGMWQTTRGTNLLDGAAPYYRTYRCADGEFVAVGAIEPQFHAALLAGLGLAPDDFPQGDQAGWPDQGRRLAELFATRTRDEWAATFEGTDACVAPVLSLREAPEHPHVVARGTFVTVDGHPQPAPAPRFSRSTAAVPSGAPEYGADTEDILDRLGIDAGRRQTLREAGVIG